MNQAIRAARDAVLGAASVCVCGFAIAQTSWTISVFPPDPRSTDVVHVHVVTDIPYVCGEPSSIPGVATTVSAQSIQIFLSLPSCFLGVPPPGQIEFETDVGPLPEGTFEIHALERTILGNGTFGGSTERGMLSFRVGAVGPIALDPPDPKPFRDVRVKIAGAALGVDLDGRPDRFDPVDTQVTMSGNKITLSPLMTGAPDFSASIPTPPLDQLVGALPPGDYLLEVLKRSQGRGSSGPVGGTIGFRVPSKSLTEPLSDYTDLWWVPSQSGWGLGLVHHPSNQIFGTLFVYGADGKPSWYVIPGGRFTDQTHFEGSIYRTTGPYFGVAFDPAQVGVTLAGTAQIAFDPYDSNAATVNFVIDGVVFHKSIQRQSF